MAVLLALAVPAVLAGEEPPEPPRTQALPTPAAELAQWFPRAAQAYENEDHGQWVTALENLHRLRPFNQDIMRQLVMGYALTGQTSEAFNVMLRMQQQGLAVQWDEIEEVAPLRRHRLYGHLRDLMAEAGKPAGSVDTLWEIGPDHPMPEALAWDRESGRVFVGTIHHGRILVRGEDEEQFRVFADRESVPPLRAVLDLLVDAERGHLWAATGSIGQYRGSRQAEFGRTGLLKLDLESGELLGEYRVLGDGQPHLLGAMTMSEDGTIFANDTITPVIYRLEPGGERPQPIISNPLLTSLRGIAVSPDARKIYVADYDLGIMFFDVAQQGAGFALGIPETLNLGGIDGLYFWRDSLVAIQNGVTPQRILRLDLDESGTRVAQVATVAKALPEFDNPTYGTLEGNDLLFLASSHWHHVAGSGRPVSPPLPPVAVMRASVDQAANVVVGEEILEQLKSQRDQ
ncbi:MAG: SMP-30/gluconolactonase/LRE family protein [Wenzhouxiangellaceae bacterium]